MARASGPEHGQSRRFVTIGFAGAVALFLASDLLTVLLALDIRREATSLVTNAGPSVQYISAVRTDLRRLEVLVDDYLDETGRPPLSAVEDMRTAARRSLHEYFSLPTYPGEQDLWPEVTESLGRLDQLVDEAIALRASDEAAAQALLASSVKPQFDRVDGALERIVVVNSEQAGRLAERIVRSWNRVMLGTFAFLLLGLGAMAFLARHTLQQIERLERELRARADELEIFAGRVAHDILSPLGSVALSLDAIAKRHPEPETLGRLHGSAKAAVGRIEGVVRALLAFARAGARPPPGTHTRVAPVVAGVLEDVRADAEGAGIALEAVMDERVEVACDAGVLTSLLSNLVRNAVKYMGAATVRRISVRAQERNGRVRLEVEDTGPGIPPDRQPLVFEPYVRVGDTKQQGIGLGLATVRRIAEAHGGAVGLRSAPGAGSLFWVELPGAAAA